MLSTMEPISLDFCAGYNFDDRSYAIPIINLEYRGLVIGGKFSLSESRLRFESAFKNVMSCQLSVNENSVIRKILGGGTLRCSRRTIYVCHAEMNYEKMLIEEAVRFAHAPDEFIEHFTQKGCDQLTIVCAEKEWKVPSDLMCIRSPVFARMLKSDFEETRTKRYIMNDVDPELVRMMVECCMTNGITKKPEYAKYHDKLMFALVNLADKYEMKHLMGIASIEVAKNISLANFMPTVRLADKHNSELLKKFCDAFQEIIICSSKVQ